MKYISLNKKNIFRNINNKIYLKIEEIKSKSILNNINGYSLDKEQRKAVLIDEDTSLIVAGAGSGKTLTMMGKIRYLVECKNINPKDILVLSFTNYTVNSFRKSLEKNINYNIDILTFHKLGINILKKANYKFKIKNSILDIIIKNYFEKELILDKKKIMDFINYFIILKEEKIDNTNYKYNTKEEIILGNFLYCNKISFKYIPYEIENNLVNYAFYLTDYNIYIVYDELGKEYDKHFIVINKDNFTDGSLFWLLYAEFNKYNIKIDEKNYLEIVNIFTHKGNKMENLYNLIITFINMLKGNNLNINRIDKIEKVLRNGKAKLENKRYIYILSIIKEIYFKYQNYLKENNLVDFNDLINKSINIIKNNEVILNYKYIIIDEFQDTSFCRYELINNIKKQTNSKLIVVGDDFQSIYRFTGCDIKMFLKFKKYFPFSKILYITNTYRNSNELVKVAGSFIMKNKEQIRKKLKSNKKISKPIKIYFYDVKAEINNLIKKVKEKNIFILGRNNKDIEYFNYIENKNNIKFMSVHKSKGLECDGIIIVNLLNSTLGFPSKCKENILIRYLCNIEDSYPYEEERRLFYVALTRTKNNVYLFTPRDNYSIFVKELIKDYKKYIEIIN